MQRTVAILTGDSTHDFQIGAAADEHAAVETLTLPTRTGSLLTAFCHILPNLQRSAPGQQRGEWSREAKVVRGVSNARIRAGDSGRPRPLLPQVTEGSACGGDTRSLRTLSLLCPEQTLCLRIPNPCLTPTSHFLCPVATPTPPLSPLLFLPRFLPPPHSQVCLLLSFSPAASID